MRRMFSFVFVAAAAGALATAAAASTQTTFIGPNSDSAAQACSGTVGPVSGPGVVHQSASCSRADVGTASGAATSAPGHVAAMAVADSHNGDSLVAKIGSEAIYLDFLTFTSSDPNQHFANVAANLLLDGILSASGPVAGGDLELFVVLNGQGFGLRENLTQDGSFHVTQDDFEVLGGTLGSVTNASLRTSFVTVALDAPILFRLQLQTGAGASGPGSHGESDFGLHSFKFAPTAFFLPDGVTVNAGDYLVDNRFIDPLAPTGGGVPEPASWTLMIAGFGLAGAALRRRRALPA
jgi:hypothetical protein